MDEAEDQQPDGPAIIDVGHLEAAPAGDHPGGHKEHPRPEKHGKKGTHGSLEKKFILHPYIKVDAFCTPLYGRVCIGLEYKSETGNVH
jgi:hypothetical protein